MTYLGDYLCRGLKEFGQNLKPKGLGYVHKVASVAGDTCIHHDDKLKCIGVEQANKNFPTSGFTDIAADYNLFCAISNKDVFCNDIRYDGWEAPIAKFENYKNIGNTLVSLMDLKPKLVNPKKLKLFGHSFYFPIICVEDERKLKCWGQVNLVLDIKDINSYSVEIFWNQVCLLSQGKLDCYLSEDIAQFSKELDPNKEWGSFNEVNLSMARDFDKYSHKVLINERPGIRNYIITFKDRNFPESPNFKDVKVGRIDGGQISKVITCVKSKEGNFCLRPWSEKSRDYQNIDIKKVCLEQNTNKTRPWRDLICLPNNIERMWFVNSEKSDFNAEGRIRDEFCYSIKRKVYCLRVDYESTYSVTPYIYHEFNFELIEVVNGRNFACFLLANKEVVCKGTSQVQVGLNEYYYSGKRGFKKQDFSSYENVNIEELIFPKINLEAIKSIDPGVYIKVEKNVDSEDLHRGFFERDEQCSALEDEVFDLQNSANIIYEKRNQSKFNNFFGENVYSFRCYSKSLKEKLGRLISKAEGPCVKTKKFEQFEVTLRNMIESIIDVENMFTSLIGPSLHLSCKN